MSTPHTTWTSQGTSALLVPVAPSSRSSDPGDPGLSSQLLTIKQIAGACQLSEKAIRRAIDDGELAVVKLRSRLRVTPQDFEEWIRSSRLAGGRVQLADPRRLRRPAPAGTFRALVGSDAPTGRQQ